eukprot:scaffold52613_cov55-Phaeocystis_antarctica.AAC.2
MLRAGAPRQRLSRERTGRGQRRVCGAQAGGGSGGGAEAADLGEDAGDPALVAGEAHAHALVPILAIAGPHHLTLLAVHDLVAVRNGLARLRVEHLLAHRVAARQRRRRIAAHLRTQPPTVWSKEARIGRRPLWRCHRSGQPAQHALGHHPSRIHACAAARAAAHAVRAGAPRHRGCRGNARAGRCSVACVGRRRGGGSGGGAEAADIGEVAVDAVCVAGKAHAHSLVPVLVSGGSRHLALLAVRDRVAVVRGHARPREEHLLAQLVAARQRRRRIAAHLRTQPPAVKGVRRQGSAAALSGAVPPTRPPARTTPSATTPPGIHAWAAARAAAHAVRAGAPRLSEAVAGTHGALQRRVGGGAEAADLGKEAVVAGTVLVAGESHEHALALGLLASSGPRHLALLAVHDLVAVLQGLARNREEHLVAHRVAARQRLRAGAES